MKEDNDKNLFGVDSGKQAKQKVSDIEDSNASTSAWIQQEAEAAADRRRDYEKAVAKATREDMERAGGLPSEVKAYNVKKSMLDEVSDMHRTASEKLRVTNEQNTKINDTMEEFDRLINPPKGNIPSDEAYAEAALIHTIEIGTKRLPGVQVSAVQMKRLAQEIENLRDQRKTVFPGQIIKLFIPKYYENKIDKKSGEIKKHKDVIVSVVKDAKADWDTRKKSQDELLVEGLKQKLDNLKSEVKTHHDKIKPIVGLLSGVSSVSGLQWKDKDTKETYMGKNLDQIITAEKEKDIVNPEDFSAGSKGKNPNLQKMGKNVETATDNVQQARQEISAKEINRWANITGKNTEKKTGRGPK